jgi:hypothetical protein
LALEETFQEASVSKYDAWLGLGLFIFLPEEATDFIAAFDDREPVSPFTFELPIEPANTPVRRTS